MNGPDLTVQLVIMRLLAGVIIFIVHGIAIAGAAVALGDRGPAHDGRLQWPPWGHVSILGLGSLMLTGFGWSQPVAIETGKLRFGRASLVLVVLAGSAALLLLGFLLLLLAGPSLKSLDFTTGLTVAAFVRVAGRLCVWMALFSLLPIPPLAGAHLLTALGYTPPQKAGFFIGWGLLLASLFGVTQQLLMPLYQLVAPLVLGVDVALTF